VRAALEPVGMRQRSRIVGDPAQVARHDLGPTPVADISNWCRHPHSSAARSHRAAEAQFAIRAGGEALGRLATMGEAAAQAMGAQHVRTTTSGAPAETKAH
jgi:hypothetical protein